jgi:large subunit ribosomal protein L4
MADIEIKVTDKNNQAKGRISLPDSVFGCEASSGLVHSAVVSHLANQRQGTHATKNRALVSGGGKKPYKQKKTGRARAGSSRSPLFRHGGTIFGPQPRDYEIRLPKTARKTALYKALSMKLADEEIIVLDSLSVEAPKTRDMVGIIETLGLTGQSVLFVLAAQDKNILLSVRNIPSAKVCQAADLNAYQVAAFDKLVFTEDAIKKVSAGEVNA